MMDTLALYLQASMSSAATTPAIAANPAHDATQRYLDLLRDHQQVYLEAAGAAAAEIRGLEQVESLAASTLQLSRQFFDAQRGFVGRVAQHRAELLGQHAADDLLDLAAWDAGAATRQLAALLDGWWAALNSKAGVTMDHAAARRALVRQIDHIQTAQSPQRHSSTPHAAPEACLPASVQALLDRSDGSDLRSLLRQLGEALEADARPVATASSAAATAPGAGSDSRVAAFASVVPSIVAERPTTGELRIRELVEPVSSATPGDPLRRLERLEQDRRQFWGPASAGGDRHGDWFPTPAVASIAVATAALSTALALIG